jgi:hypothetical protein
MTLPPDLPDDPVDVMPVFTSRRKSSDLPPLRSAAVSNAFEPKTSKGLRIVALYGWQSGFRWGVAATVGGVALFAVVAAEVLK